MRPSLFLALALSLLSAGCGKKETTTPQAVESAASQVESSPAEQTSAPAGEVSDSGPAPLSTTQARPISKGANTGVNQPPAQPVPTAAALEGAVHAFMTIQLHKFIQANGRMPKDFSEFANSRMDSVPFAPEGMEYAIDYVNKQVKVVKRKK